MKRKKRKVPAGTKGAAKRYVLSVRFPPDKLPALDRYVARLQKRTPGGNWSRSSAGLNAILQKLEEGEES